MAAFPGSLAAQLVRGEIVDALNRRPVPAAFVLLMDSAGTEAARTCRGRPDEGAAAATLWEEIQKALAATEWEQHARRYRFWTVTVERTLDRYAGLAPGSHPGRSGR